LARRSEVEALEDEEYYAKDRHCCAEIAREGEEDDGFSQDRGGGCVAVSI